MTRPIFSICDSLISGFFSIFTPVGELQLQASSDGVMSVCPNKQNVEKAESSLFDGMNLTTQQKIIVHLEQGEQELEAYFRGDLIQFSVSLDLRGTVFQQLVWQELQRIEYGESCSYQDIAERIGRPKAVRAVGSANGANPVGIIVPCHRVIGKNGTLTGYAHGLEMKQYLLELENHTPKFAFRYP